MGRLPIDTDFTPHQGKAGVNNDRMRVFGRPDPIVLGWMPAPRRVGGRPEDVPPGIPKKNERFTNGGGVGKTSSSSCSPSGRRPLSSLSPFSRLPRLMHGIPLVIQCTSRG